MGDLTKSREISLEMRCAIFFKETFPYTYIHSGKVCLSGEKSLLGDPTKSRETSLEIRCAIFLKETFPYAYVCTEKVSLRKIAHLVSNEVSRDLLKETFWLKIEFELWNS